MKHPQYLTILLLAIGSTATFTAEVTPPAPVVTAPAAQQTAPAPAPTLPAASAAKTATEPPADSAPAWQRPRVFLGALVEDGGSFDGKPMPRVTRLIAGSIFDKLGIKEGDQLALLNGSAITSSEIFRTLNAALKPGDGLKLTFIRDGVSREVTGTAEAPPRPREIMADTEALKTQLSHIKDEVDRAKVRTNLEETLRLLREFETGLPAAAAEFKRVYPGGTFNIQLHVDIRSEVNDPTAQPLTPAAVNTSVNNITPTPAAAAAPTAPDGKPLPSPTQPIGR